MAYDSKTFGQSPFGNVSKPGVSKPNDTGKTSPDDGLDIGSKKNSPTANTAQRKSTSSFSAPSTNTLSGISSSSSAATVKSSSPTAEKTTKRKSKGSKTGAKSTRKSKKAKAAEVAAADAAALEAEIARRFLEEDQQAYLSLLQYTAISGLVWAVLRLSRYELSKEAIAVVNVLINPLVISIVALCSVATLTFLARRLLKDLANHTRKLQIDAETEDSKNFRPTIEIVGDALEYNPKLRKNIARLFNAAAILACSLISYLLVIGISLAWQIK